jgi:hypothetical protein
MKLKEVLTEAIKQRLDPKCWKGKHKEGTKIKGGVRVNNCVPNESVAEGEEKRCMQCGMKNCTCPGDSCKCKPIKGWIPGKGFKKAMDEAASAAQQAAIAVSMKKAGKKPKKESVDESIDELSRVLELSGLNLTPEEEFDIIENFVESIAKQHNVDAEVVWEDFEALDDNELYSLCEDWQKTNKQDNTDGMSQKAVNAYRRENPGSKLKTAVTTKPSKLKKGSKASKRRSSYCSRSAGQKRMHHIDCSKTPDKAICKARRRWNC